MLTRATQGWSDVVTHDPDLDLRLRRLEASATIQEAILVGIQKELIEADRLIDVITRLGDGADALGAALIEVESQQQVLARHEDELNEVREKAEQAPTVEDVEKRVEHGRKERRKLAISVGAALAAVAVLLFGLVFYISDSTHHACENRQAGTRALRDTLASFQDPNNPHPKIAAGVERVNATLTETCDEQYPLHLGAAK